jgi:phosphonopyruvate decarboxylase
MMQNSGLGNAVSPLTSLAWVFRLPVLVVCTHRGAPGVHDEPQHELMGRITRELLAAIDVPCADFPREPEQIEPALAAAQEFLDRQRRPYALLMQKGAVAPHALAGAALPRREPRALPVPAAGPGRPRPSRRQVLERIIQRTSPGRSAVFASTGFAGRELYALADRPNQFYMVGSMGCASSLGLGFSLVRERVETVVIDGDGAALMRLGNLATVGCYAGGNYTHVILDNEAHESTGAQATVSAGVEFAAVAAACGYRTVLAGDDPALVDEVVDRPELPGPRLLHLKIRTGTLENLPRPKVTPVEVAERFREHFQ